MVKKQNSTDQLNAISAQSYLVRGGYQRTHYQETNEAIFMNSGFVYENAEQAEAAFKGETNNYIYSRYANPIISVFEKKMARLEGGVNGGEIGCIATATGMAAVYAALACSLKSGDRIVAAKQLFYSCYYILSDLLPRFGVKVDFVDGTDLNAWEEALSTPANIVFFETPTNPMLDILDIKAISTLAHQAGAIVMLDNVFATPCYQRPFDFGVDVITYSATKHIDGQGRALGGAILGSKDFIEDHLRPFVRHTGPGLSPFNAWLLEKGLETLHVRVDAMSKSASKVAQFLESCAQLQRLSYPGLKSHPQHELAASQMTGFSTLIAFTLRDDTKQAAFTLLNRLKMIDISNNFGDAKSLITHPATTTHSKLSDAEKQRQGISDGTLRLSIGLERADDVINDLSQALIFS